MDFMIARLTEETLNVSSGTAVVFLAYVAEVVRRLTHGFDYAKGVR